MQWDEPLGNESDDVRFLQSIARHRGESVAKTVRELHVAGVLQTDNVKRDTKTFLDSVCSAGFHFPKSTITDEKQIVQQDHRDLQVLVI